MRDDGSPERDHQLAPWTGKTGRPNRSGVVDLANSRNLSVDHGEVLGDAELAEASDLHVVEQHRFIFLGKLGQQGDALDQGAKSG